MVATLPTASTFPPAVSEAVEGAAATFFRGSCGLTHVPDAQIDDTVDQAGIMSTISFVGDIQWAFALAFPEEAAIGLARTFAGFDIPFDSVDMGDVIGEIVNVIAGDVVGRLAKQKIEARMSLPTTVRGSNVSMMMPTDAAATRFVFSGPAGTCWFDLVATPKPLASPDQQENPEAATRWGGSDPPAPPMTPPPVGNLAPVAAPADVPSPNVDPDPSQDAWAAAMAEAERQMAEQDEVDAAARAAGLPVGNATAQPVVVQGGSRMMPLVLVLACAGWGGLISLIAAGGPHRPAPEPATAEHTEAVAAPKAPTAEVDELIRNDQFDDALKACFKAAKKDPRPSETALTLREALCLEGQGRWGEAVGAYQRAEADPDTVTSVVALLGQARCATQDGSYVIARSLTNRALLRSGAPGFRGTTVRKDIQHLQARIALQAAGAKPLPRDASARPLLSASPTNGLEWLPTAPPPPAPTGDTFEVHRILGAPKMLQVSGSLSRRPVLEVLNTLAATAGWKLHVSDVAAQLKWAVGPIEIDHITLPEFLNVLMDGTSVTWAVDADTLRLARPVRKDAPQKK